MISKTAFESLPHNCGVADCNYKRLKNREYFRARAQGLPENVLFLPTKSRAKRVGFSLSAMLKQHETQAVS
ncbi:MAG: hypothetical protein WC426_13500 [Sulfuriferula sp.]